MEIREMKEILLDTDHELTLTSRDTAWESMATRLHRVVEEMRSRAQAAYADENARMARAARARQHEFDTDMTGQDEEAFNGEDA